MASKERYSLNPRVLLTELGDGTGVLLHLETKFYYTLNPTALFVWRLLSTDNNLDTSSIAEKISTVYSVSQEAARSDVERVLDDMSAEGLVVPD